MIRRVARAKINFFLEITGKRSDGYHMLSTIFQTISLGDELNFAPAKDLTLSCSDPSLPTDERNLVMRAAQLLQEKLKEPRGAKIHLNKIVPMGAGLGGGSADAAATLQGLLKLWNRRIGGPALRRLAVQLGADVPFFLKGGLCSATGIGDKLKALKPLPKTWMVIVWPGFGISTKEAYSKVVIPVKPGIQKLSWAPASAGVTSMKLFNRFESLVFPGHPQLPKLKAEFLKSGAVATQMSGSGSAVFGLAKSRAHGKQILAAMQKQYNQCWLVHTI